MTRAAGALSRFHRIVSFVSSVPHCARSLKCCDCALRVVVLVSMICVRGKGPGEFSILSILPPEFCLQLEQGVIRARGLKPAEFIGRWKLGRYVELSAHFSPACSLLTYEFSAHADVHSRVMNSTEVRTDQLCLVLCDGIGTLRSTQTSITTFCHRRRAGSG